MHHTGIADENDDERNERIDDEVHPGEVIGEKIFVGSLRWTDQVRAAHRQNGFRRLILLEVKVLFRFGTEENQIVRVEKEKNRINDDQRAKRMSVTEHVRIPNQPTSDRSAFDRNRAENPHGAVRKITGDEFISSTKINRTLEKIRLKCVTSDQTKAIQHDQNEILEGESARLQVERTNEKILPLNFPRRRESNNRISGISFG